MTQYQPLPTNSFANNFAGNSGFAPSYNPSGGYNPPTPNAPTSYNMSGGPTTPSASSRTVSGLLPQIDVNYDPTGAGNNNSILNRNSGLIPGLEVFSNLAGAYAGLEQLNLNRDAFRFNRNLAQTNLANQAQITNAAITDRARAGALQRGVSSDELDALVERQTANRRIRGTL